ncbi:MAG TPA: tail length tape measure protein, partial [Cyanobacteria bacterium UBA11049]|nr:tail length tape measure protein [Cyanobacteria bacterium UBA11049]
GDRAKTQAAFLDLLNRYPQNPVAAEALYVLGRTEPKYWQQAVTQFPSHPRTIEIARLLLQKNPNQPRLQLLLAKYADDRPGILPVLNNLVSKSKAQLQPQDWETVAQAYWENKQYALAATAYSKAPHTPENLYRLGRSLHLSNRRTQAIATYQQLIRAFPNTKETGTALMNLARMVEKQKAIAYLDL